MNIHESEVNDDRKRLLNYTQSVISSQSTQFNFRGSEVVTDKDSFVKKEIGDIKTTPDIDTVKIKEELYEDNE